jgi:hypothetical protein
MAQRLLFETDNGSVFNIALDPGLCFAMCLDVAKVQLENIKRGRPDLPPALDNLSPGKWAIDQSAYEINKSKKRDAMRREVDIVEAQGLAIVSRVEPTDFDDDFGWVSDEVTENSGVNVFVIVGPDGGHALLWARDDDSGLYIYLDPNDGLSAFDDLQEAREFIEEDLSGGYPGLNKHYRRYQLELE